MVVNVWGLAGVPVQYACLCVCVRVLGRRGGWRVCERGGVWVGACSWMSWTLSDLWVIRKVRAAV
jgi:hypothetical protein